MTRFQTLILFRELLRDAAIMKSAQDDPSGLQTQYLVDQEQLMKNIEAELDKGRVTYCNWCPDPEHPDPLSHPDGDLEHSNPN